MLKTYREVAIAAQSGSRRTRPGKELLPLQLLDLPQDPLLARRAGPDGFRLLSVKRPRAIPVQYAEEPNTTSAATAEFAPSAWAPKRPSERCTGSISGASRTSRRELARVPITYVDGATTVGKAAGILQPSVSVGASSLDHELLGPDRRRVLRQPEGNHCVDIFRRDDGTFGFEEYRRDPEDLKGWFPFTGMRASCSRPTRTRLESAKANVEWLATH